MTDGQRHALAFCAALVVVALALALIAAAGVRFSPDVATVQPAAAPVPTQSAVADSAARAPTAPPQKAAPVPPAPPPPQPDGGVYRCVQGGQVTYADRPCPGATAVDVRPAIGSYAAPRAPGVAAAVDEAPPPMTLPAAPPSGTASDLDEQVRQRLCASIRAGIEQIDAAARVGGSAAYQDDLRRRRRALEDARYEHRC